jgi:hypothetical protein
MLIESLRNITLLIKVLWTHLGDVQVNEVREVSIQLPLLITFKTSSINVVIRTNVFVRDNVLRFAIFVTGGLNIMDLEVSVLLCFIYLEEEVLFRDNFGVGGLSQCFLVELVFKVLQDELLLYNSVNFILNLLDCRDIAG